MATNAQTTPATTAKKPAKPPVPVYTRMQDQMKKAAMANKLTAEELDKLAALAAALKTFMAA